MALYGTCNFNKGTNYQLRPPSQQGFISSQPKTGRQNKATTPGSHPCGLQKRDLWSDLSMGAITWAVQSGAAAGINSHYTWWFARSSWPYLLHYACLYWPISSHYMWLTWIYASNIRRQLLGKNKKCSFLPANIVSFRSTLGLPCKWSLAMEGGKKRWLANMAHFLTSCIAVNILTIGKQKHSNEIRTGKNRC